MQILYAIPSERRLCEQLRYNLLLRWFVGLPLDAPVWHPTTFTKNRDRLLTTAVAEAFFRVIRSQAEAHKLLCREHFSLDGTLIEAAASLKSLRPIEAGDDDERRPRPAGATPRSTGAVSGVPTRPTARPPTPRRGSRARGTARRRSSATPATA